MSSQPLWSRVVAGITRLCEPFQQALTGMPLEKLAPANEEEARQRLLEVVDQELGRIGRFRAMLQKIADADLAEAPVRLAFENGTEGDRGRRYILSYERLVNRRIDTFLKVRTEEDTHCGACSPLLFGWAHWRCVACPFGHFGHFLLLPISDVLLITFLRPSRDAF
jgi:hypothetical protein